MSDLSHHDPTTRFNDLAELYARCRPDYPSTAIDHLLHQAHLRADTLVVDIGCGTGISSRLLAARGIPVLGIEPNESMRGQALAQGTLANLSYRAGRAEQTGLPEGCARAVLAAQAFHWFEAERALREFFRILQPGGWVFLMWNERDERDPATAAYGAVVRATPGARAVEGPRALAGQALLASSLFEHGERKTFQHQQVLDEEGLLGRSFSASHAPREPAQAEHYAAQLREVFARFQHQGRFSIRYETSIYQAQRPLNLG